MQAVQYYESEMQAPVLAGRVGARSVAVFSRRSPSKETPNEDSALFVPWDERTALVAVADGLGGANLGEAASRTAVAALAAAVESADRETTQLRTAIIDGIEDANTRVRQLGGGAATTLAVVEFAVGGPDGDTARAYHVGDSGVLVCGGRGKLKMATTAHSPVGYGVEAGFLDDREAMHHEDRHLVSNVIGCATSRIEVGPPLALARRDTVVVASDGLFDNVTNEEIVHLARRGATLDAARRLAEAASERMASLIPGAPSKPDDLTLVVVR